MFWLGAIVSLCYIPGVTGAYIATQWPVLAVTMSLGLLRAGQFTAYHAAILAFVAYAFASWFHSPTPDASVFGLWLIVIMGSCVWFGSTMASVEGLYAGLAIGGAVSSLIAVLQYFGFSTVQTISADPAGLYVNSVQQGTTLALIIVALISERVWIWALPVMLPGVWLAHSRGAWIALAVGLLACYVRRAWVFGIVAAAGAFYLLGPLNEHDAERMFIWQATWSSLTWLGWGPGVFYSILMSRDGGVTTFYPEYAHNDVLQLTFEYGAGAVLMLSVFARALWRRRASEWPIVVAFVAAGCYSMPLFMPIASFLALVAVGRILRGDALDVGNGDRRRQSLVSWSDEARGQLVPVASHSASKG